MAMIRRLRDGQLRPLPSRCLIGRAPQADLLLEDPFASSDHASIQWNGSAWELRDLGSSNGTFLDGERLLPGVRAALHVGARLGFGEAHAHFELTALDPPQALAVREGDGMVRGAERALLALPNDQSPELSVFLDGGLWVIEGPDGRRPASDGERLEVGGQTWTLTLPELDESTPIAVRRLSLEVVSLRFQRQPTPSWSLSGAGKQVALEWRWHAPFLLELARARLADQALPTAEQGWRSLDALSEALGMNGKVLNVATHEARLQLGAAGLEGAPGMVEVKRGWRRLGIARISITD